MDIDTETEKKSRVEVHHLQDESMLLCLRKVHCVPGTEMPQVEALRGLAAIGRGEAPNGQAAPNTMNVEELQGLLRDAGSALLEQAGELAGQLERGEVCAALQYLSFRCFCAVDVLHQATSGVSEDALPEGDALWGPILQAWGSVRSGVGVDGALADLTRWWRQRQVADVAEQGGPVAHADTAEAAMEAALTDLQQQAEQEQG